MGTELCFLNTYRKDAVDSVLAGKKDGKVLAFSIEAAHALRQAKVDYEYVDDHFPIKLHATMDKLSNRMSETWYEPFGKGLEYKGIDIGPIFMRYISYYFRDGLKCFSIATNIIKKEKPSKVLCSPPLTYGRWSTSITMPNYTHLPHALETVCKNQDIPFEYLATEENDQVFEVKRQERKFFDLAVKGRNLLRDMAHKYKLGKKTGMRKVLSVMLKPGMLEMLKELGLDKKLEFIDYLQASDVMSFTRSKEIDDFMAKARAQWEDLRGKGKDLPGIPKEMARLKDTLDVDFRALFNDPFAEVLYEIDRISTILKEFEVDFMLVVEDMTPPAKARVAAAEHLGIPSGVVMHGFLPHTWHARYAPPTATYNFVWGPGFIKSFTNEGFPKDRTIVTGLTVADIVYAKPSDEEIEKVRTELGLPKNKKVVLWATQPLFTNFTSRSLKGFEKEIIDILKIMKDRKERLVVKPHPIDPIETYRMLAAEVGSDAAITKSYLSPLLQICDVLVADHSTVGLQAIALRKPFILLQTHMQKDLCGYVDGKVALPVYDLKDLPPLLDRILVKGEDVLPKKAVLDRFLEDYAEGADGSALRTLVDSIIKVIPDISK